MQLFSYRHLVRLHCAQKHFPEGSLGQRFLLPELPDTVATVLENGQWFLESSKGGMARVSEIMEHASFDDIIEQSS